MTRVEVWGTPFFLGLDAFVVKGHIHKALGKPECGFTQCKCVCACVCVFYIYVYKYGFMYVYGVYGCIYK